MSIADHFEQAPDARFVRNYTASAARRQWHMSLVVLAVIGAASAAISATVRFDQPNAVATVATSAPPSYAGHL